MLERVTLKGDGAGDVERCRVRRNAVETWKLVARAEQVRAFVYDELLDQFMQENWSNWGAEFTREAFIRGIGQ